MTVFELAGDVVDMPVLERAARHLGKTSVSLPTFAQLADPLTGLAAHGNAASNVDPDDPRAENLFRVHWYNDDHRTGLAKTPAHFVLEPSFTGVAAPIIVMLGDLFPMIRAHKVLAAYACLAARLVTGQFDPTRHRAVWPSTGNYCRGGVAISRILGCRGVAVLPEGMSKERFDWLDGWVRDPSDIVRTPGTESNVKEIYDKCAELERDPENVILNQFSEFANYLAHYTCTGQALETVFLDVQKTRAVEKLAGFVAGTGSAGTLGAGDYLKHKFQSRNIAMEPVECPTMLYNGYGEHNIQGIGDKHIPLIQNVMNLDMVAGVSDASSDSLYVLFNSKEGRNYLGNRAGVDKATLKNLERLGLSGIANVLAAVKSARRLNLGPEEALITVATDSGNLYASEVPAILDKRFNGTFDQVSAGEAYATHVLGLGADHVMELSHRDRRRIFNLGYYTWVEQQGISLEEFDRRLDQAFWTGLQDLPGRWDHLIDEFNEKSGVPQ